MANKVSIFIINAEGLPFELSNSKMSLMPAYKYSGVNWLSVFGYECSPYDVILYDFGNNSNSLCNHGYSMVQRCNDKETSEYIISVCLSKLKEQYERMMMIRVSKKYDLNPIALFNIELEYHSQKNYEVDISSLLRNEMGELCDDSTGNTAKVPIINTDAE